MGHAGTLLTSESGAPATDFFLVAFPEDRALWHAASPRIRVVRPAADGAFSIRDLPAGDYRLAALGDVDDDEPRRRDVLESIYDTGLRVTVEEGRRAVRELRIKEAGQGPRQRPGGPGRPACRHL